jgi:hypothetical protein
VRGRHLDVSRLKRQRPTDAVIRETALRYLLRGIDVSKLDNDRARHQCIYSFHIQRAELFDRGQLLPEAPSRVQFLLPHCR